MAEINEYGYIEIAYNLGNMREVTPTLFLELFDNDLVDEDGDWVAGETAYAAFEIGRDYGSES